MSYILASFLNSEFLKHVKYNCLIVAGVFLKIEDLWQLSMLFRCKADFGRELRWICGRQDKERERNYSPI